MFLCRFDIKFFAYAINFDQNFEWDNFFRTRKNIWTKNM